MKKIRTLGTYIFPDDSEVKWDQIMGQMQDAGYTSFSLFIGHPVMEKWPIAYDPFLKACGEHHIDPHVSFCDQFLPTNCALYKMFGADYEDALYNSWDGSKYRWLSWSESKGHKFSNFQLVGTQGKRVAEYVNFTIKKMRQWCNKYPDMIPTFKWGNETAAVHKDNKTIGTRGDRCEAQFHWLRQQWINHGFTFGEDVWQYYDYCCVNEGKHKVDPDFYNYEDIKTAFEAAENHGAGVKLEFHGMLCVNDVIKLHNATGIPLWKIKASTDGDLGMKGKYAELGQSDLPDVDLKLDCTPAEAKKWEAMTNMQKFNFKWPKYKTYIRT